MNDSERNAVNGATKLWPHLTFEERCDWVDRLRYLFNDDFVRTVSVLSGQTPFE